MSNCTVYLVRFPEESLPLDQGPVTYSCDAEDAEQASAQAEIMYPGCDVICVKS